MAPLLLCSQATACLKQPTLACAPGEAMNDDTKANELCCPAGWKVVNIDSKDTRASCEACGPNTFTIAAGQTSCEEQVQCGKGQKMSAFSTTTKGQCEGCGIYSDDPNVPNRYMDIPTHRETECKDQSTCGKAKRYFEPDGNRQQAQCLACESKCQSQPKDVHYDKECTSQDTFRCAPGQFVKDLCNQDVAPSCGACPEQTYTDTRNAKPKCFDQPTCDPGEYYDDHDDDRKRKAECLPCKADHFLAAAKHRKTSATCTLQPACPDAGTKYDGSDKAKQRTCDECDPNHYQIKAGHRETKCTAQPKCTRGERLTANTTTLAGTCVLCKAGEYQAADDFQGTACAQHPTCPDGQFLHASSTSARGVCTVCDSATCGDGQFRSGTCAGIINGFQCTKQGECREDQFLRGATQESAGVCMACNNTTCAEGQYRTGTCGEEKGELARCSPRDLDRSRARFLLSPPAWPRGLLCAKGWVAPLWRQIRTHAVCTSREVYLPRVC